MKEVREMPRSQSLEICSRILWVILDLPGSRGRWEDLSLSLQAEFWTYRSGPSRQFPLLETPNRVPMQ